MSKLLIVGLAVILVVGVGASQADAATTWCVYTGQPEGNDCPDGEFVTFCVLCTSQWPPAGECPTPAVWIVSGIDCKFTSCRPSGDCMDCPNGVEYTHADFKLCNSDTCTMEISPPTAVGGAPAAGSGLKLRASPNPSSRPLTIQYALPVMGDIQLFVTDATGSVKAMLVSGTASRGPHEFVWDGKDRDGRHLPAGVYYLHLEAGGASKTVRAARLQ